MKTDRRKNQQQLKVKFNCPKKIDVNKNFVTRCWVNVKLWSMTVNPWQQGADVKPKFKLQDNPYN